MALVAAICLLAAMMLTAIPEHFTARRLRAMSRLASGFDGNQTKPVRCGIGVTLSAIIASLQAGSGVVQALQRAREPTAVNGACMTASAICDCEGNIDVVQISRVFDACRLPEESRAHSARVACDVCVASDISVRSGCPAARCFEAVHSSYKRARLQEDLRNNAFAVPKSTTRMLLALPAVVVVFAQFLGAQPLAMLFGSVQGFAMLCLGVLCYAGGFAWMRKLMSESQIAV